MLNAIFRPIEAWPGHKRDPDRRQPTPFASTFNRTLQLLESELAHLDAKYVVIQVEVDLKQIRFDGWLRSDAKVRGPAVILTFTWDGAVYSYPCDKFTHWHANLRAIALSLEALRKVDRYGVTISNEQYQGFKQLASVESLDERELALKVLEGLSGLFLGDAPTQEAIEASYKLAARRTHPDLTGGAADDFKTLQAVMEILRPKERGRR